MFPYYNCLMKSCMFSFLQLVVLSALFAVTCAKPSGLFHLPSAISHVSRSDVIHSSPVVTYAAAPVVHAPVVHAPLVSHALPAATSHQYRTDYYNSHDIATPVVVHSAPVLLDGHYGYGSEHYGW